MSAYLIWFNLQRQFDIFASLKQIPVQRQSYLRNISKSWICADCPGPGALNGI